MAGRRLRHEPGSLPLELDLFVHKLRSAGAWRLGRAGLAAQFHSRYPILRAGFLRAEIGGAGCPSRPLVFELGPRLKRLADRVYAASDFSNDLSPALRLTSGLLRGCTRPAGI
jgi:hypothetical protein